MANYMAEVAKMLGVELGEEFEIDYGKDRKSTVNITKTGLHIIETNMVDFLGDLNRATLDWLLIGYCTIKYQPWKPKYGDCYWAVSADPTEHIHYLRWEGSPSDYSNYKLGNCYQTMEAAKENKSKWVSFYESDEVLEV